MTSPARIAANQANSKKSTGPKSVAGKSRASLNALKHGMRAETVVLPTEGTREFQEHVDKWMSDWQPPTETRRWLVERAAIAAWRCDRCVRQESARLGGRVQKALLDWDKKRAIQVEGFQAIFPENPTEALQDLQQIPEGLAQLIDACKDLLDTLVNPKAWVDPDDHHGLFIRMFGLTESHGKLDLYGADPDGLDRFGIDDLTKKEAVMIVQTSESLLRHNLAEQGKSAFLDNAADVAGRLHNLLANRIGLLEEMLERIDDRWTTRIKHAEMVGLTPLKDDVLSQRYEAHHEREVRANIALVMRLEKTGEDLVGLSAIEESLADQTNPIPTAITPDPASPEPANKPIPADKTPLPNEANVEAPVHPVSDLDLALTSVVEVISGSATPGLAS